MLIGIVFALVAALSYGLSDFFAGLAAGRSGVVRTTTRLYLAATTVAALFLLVPGSAWSPGAVLWGALGGVCAIVGFLGFYAAMAAGPMSLVSAIIAVMESVVPITVSIARGEQLSALAWAAIAVAMASTALISLHHSDRSMHIAPRTIVISVVSALGLGGSVTVFDFAPAGSGVAPAFVELAAGLLVLLALTGAAVKAAPVRRVIASLEPRTTHSTAHSSSPSPRSMLSARSVAGVTVAGGALLGIATALIALAMHHGSLAVTSVIMGTYPLSTIVLARIVLKERMTLLQSGGVGLALAAAAVLAVATG
jgi:drug/metabolite transporter (DMT)-like permease